MKKLLVLCISMLLCGCSCSTQNNTTTTPSPSPTPSASPTTDSSLNQNGSAYSAQDYLDYLSNNYTLNNPTQIDNLDGNAQEGYMFGMDNADFYLLRFDRNNQSASQWLDEAMQNGYIEVKVGDQMKKYYAIVNQDYMLLYDTENLDSGFREYFQNFDLNGTGTMNRAN